MGLTPILAAVEAQDGFMVETLLKMEEGDLQRRANADYENRNGVTALVRGAGRCELKVPSVWPGGNSDIGSFLCVVRGFGGGAIRTGDLTARPPWNLDFSARLPVVFFILTVLVRFVYQTTHS